MCAFAACAMMLTACKDKNPPIVVPDDPTEPVIEKEEAPVLEEPGAGKVTIAVRVPEGTCNGIVAVGSNGTSELSWDPAGTDFTPVEGTKSWYQVTLTFAPDMAVKVIAKDEAGKITWNTQWGKNTDEKENVTWVGKVLTDFKLENGGEVQLVGFGANEETKKESAEGKVLYLDVDAWKSSPCVEKNKAGMATWKVTVPETTPATAVVSVVGGWGVSGDDEFWVLGAVIMERQEDGTYTLTKEVPEKFEYKYVVSADGITWSWDYEYGVQFAMPLSLNAVDVVEAWKSEPWAVAE